MDAIGQAFRAFKEGKMGDNPKTGCMAHIVIPEIDAGEVLATSEVPIKADDTEESLAKRVHWIEKPTLIRGILEMIRRHESDSMSSSDETEYKIRKGKVRDIWHIGYGLLAMVTSNRISGFDRHLGNVPKKGLYLTETSAWWFKKTRCMIPNHMVYNHQNIMIVKECKPIPIEVVVRGYMSRSRTSTSLWVNYQKSPVYCGIEFPPGLTANCKLPKPVVTPTTKEEDHDRPISRDDIINGNFGVTEEEWDYIERKALELFDYASSCVAQAGLILADTKFEFGRDKKGRIILIDEIFTPDSSRFWKYDTYNSMLQNGLDPESLDKDLIRKWVADQGDPYDPEFLVPQIPPDVITRVERSYYEFYKSLDNDRGGFSRMNPSDNGLCEDVVNFLDNYFFRFHSPICVIITDSLDHENRLVVDKITSTLQELNVYSFVQSLSPFKDTGRLLCVLDDYSEDVDTGRKIVFCCVSNNPSALAGIVSCNTSVPVITCPVIKDLSFLNQKCDVSLNFVLNPINCAKQVNKILSLGKHYNRSS